MNVETERLVREIRAHAGTINSYIADERASSRFGPVQLAYTGRSYFLQPDKHRLEATTNGQATVTVAIGPRVRKYLPAKNEIWEYDIDFQSRMLPLASDISDLRNPFYLTDDTGLDFRGKVTLEDHIMYHFVSTLWHPPDDGLLDTRKGFTIRYRPKPLPIAVALFVDVGDCLLRKRVGTTADGTKVLEADYRIEGINVSLDESLFQLNDLHGSFRKVALREVFQAALNPDSADAPPSRN